MGGRATLFALSLALGTSVALAAQQPAQDGDTESSDGGQIVVTGRAQARDKAFERTVREFVAQIGKPGPIGQLSRWGDPVCPMVQGLSEGFDRFVEHRIREVAASVGAPSEGDCAQYNVWVVITEQPDRFMADVRRNHPALLGYHYVGQRKSLAAFESPMKSWYATGTTIVGQGAQLDHAYGPGLPENSGSRIKPLYQSRFAFVLVVVDFDAIEGQAIGPVADRIAMQVLGNARSHPGCAALPSVLDYLESDCPEGAEIEGITAFDRAYLEGLYAFDRNELRGYMRGTIAKQIAAEADGPQP